MQQIEILGTFDGLNMVEENGNTYPVPPNYASKSKLLEGDQLKLYIKPDGAYIFKQVKPIASKRVIGKIFFDDEDNCFKAIIDDKECSLLQASVNYYKPQDGDQAVFKVPIKGFFTYAAIENVLKTKNLHPDEEEL